MNIKTIAFFICCLANIPLTHAQEIQYRMPEENALHEGTWLQWPHPYLYGPGFAEDVEPTFIAITAALQVGEKVHIIAYDSLELAHIAGVLLNAGVPFSNLDFFIYPTDDVWVRDNGPMFVYDENDQLVILDWGFNGWGFDTPYSHCDPIPEKIADDLDLPWVDLSAMVLEGGAVEHDGKGTLVATRSSVTHSSRNPGLTESEIENYLTTYMGIAKFIWLDGEYGVDITDMHVDGFLKFANDSTIVTMNNAGLFYWYLSQSDINTIFDATNAEGEPYNFVFLPLTKNNVVNTNGNNLGYKGSYVNYYVGNEVVLVPTYNDPRDSTAVAIVQSLYPDRTAVGIDVRNLYEYGGMVHCVVQQQPVDLNPATGIWNQFHDTPFLSQNFPNPFADYTILEWNLGERTGCKLEIFNTFGQKIQSFELGNKNQIELRAENFSAGIYFYTLVDNGEIIAGKSMVVLK